MENHNALHPFAFDSTGGFARYCQKFENEYKKNNSESPSRFPILLRWTFAYIQEISNQYRLFGVLYNIRVKETTNKLENQMKELVDKKTNDSIDVLKREAENAVKSATEDAKKQAENAASRAQEATWYASQAKKDAEKAATDAVQDKMHEVTEHISETSVTILGIFSGIVLTIVAGLFYSSSVLESVAEADIYKLLAIAGMVGFVCISILAVMFHYIEKIRKGKEASKIKLSKGHGFVIALDMVLVIIMFVAANRYSKSLMDNDGQMQQESTCIAETITESNEYSTEEVVESDLISIETRIGE